MRDNIMKKNVQKNMEQMTNSHSERKKKRTSQYELAQNQDYKFIHMVCTCLPYEHGRQPVWCVCCVCLRVKSASISKFYNI